MKDIFEGTGAPISDTGFQGAARSLGTEADPAALWSILAVETRGFGYLPDRRPKILFERHIFHKQTKGRFSAANPDISNPDPGGYSGGAAEYQRLKRAMLLDRIAALESASWGLGQVMGFNAGRVGYSGVEAMIEDFKAGEDAQLAACAAFIKSSPALGKAFDGRDWARVAFYYNGSTYKKNAYDTKLQTSYAAARRSPPNVGIRAAQARLTFLGYDPRGIDGINGGGTRAAIARFCQDRKLPVPPDRPGDLDAAFVEALKAAAGA
jgi:hypothetical protein